MNTRWVLNIKMDIKEMEWEDVDWFQMAQDTDQGRVSFKRWRNVGFNKTLGISCVAKQQRFRPMDLVWIPEVYSK
jgi:hypothetical protein